MVDWSKVRVDWYNVPDTARAGQTFKIGLQFDNLNDEDIKVTATFYYVDDSNVAHQIGTDTFTAYARTRTQYLTRFEYTMPNHDARLHVECDLVGAQSGDSTHCARDKTIKLSTAGPSPDKVRVSLSAPDTAEPGEQVRCDISLYNGNTETLTADVSIYANGVYINEIQRTLQPYVTDNIYDACGVTMPSGDLTIHVVAKFYYNGALVFTKTVDKTITNTSPQPEPQNGSGSDNEVLKTLLIAGVIMAPFVVSNRKG